MPTLPQKTAADKPADIDWAAALQADMLSVVRQAIEHLVGAELAAVLGPPYARGGARVGYRHGSKVRTITSPVGAVTLTVPRARLQAGAERHRMAEPGPAGVRSADAPGQRGRAAGLPVRGEHAPDPGRPEAAAAGARVVEERDQPDRPGVEGAARGLADARRWRTSISSPSTWMAFTCGSGWAGA